MKNIFWFIALFALKPFMNEINAQDMEPIKVKVYELSGNDTLPIIGADVVWTGTTVGNVTDIDGWAVIPCIMDYPHLLSISFVGYPSDTFLVIKKYRRLLACSVPSFLMKPNDTILISGYVYWIYSYEDPRGFPTLITKIVY